MGLCESCGVSEVETQFIKVGTKGFSVCARCYAIIAAEKARRAAAEAKREYYELMKSKT